MLNVFWKEIAEERYVQLYDGRKMLLENIVNPSASRLKIGEWFRIDRDVIAKNREKIRRVCNEAGDVGAGYWERFEESNKIADENPDQYPHIIETYIFKHNWAYKTGQEMRDMCKEIGDGWCDNVICDLELQMRICDGESAHTLFREGDRLPYKRAIQPRDGGIGFLGGGFEHDLNIDIPPAYIVRYSFVPDSKYYNCTPYAFRRGSRSTEH